MAKQTSAKPGPAKRTSKPSGKQATQAALKAKRPTPITEAKSAKAASKNQVAAKPARQAADPKLRDQVRAAFEKGETRTQLRARFNLSYPQVYNMTKDLGTQEHGRDRIVIDDPDNKGKKISRKAAMQRDFLAGMSVGDIGRKYGVIYQVAYQATAAQLDAPKSTAKAKSAGKGKATAKA